MCISRDWRAIGRKSRTLIQALKTKELRKKILFVLFIIIVYRIGSFIPTPGVDYNVVNKCMATIGSASQENFIGLVNLFSGGAMLQLSIFALGVMPYISASIIMQLLQVVSPDIKRMAKEEGQAGRRKITQYTRYLTVLITLVQGLGIAVGLENMTSPAGSPIVLNPGWHFRLVTMMTFTAGSVLVMWLGEQITERGIGNGISLIIFCGIVVGIPRGIIQSVALIQAGDMSIFMAVVIVVFMAAVTVCIVFVERAQRRIPISYAKRQVGRKMFGGQNSHLPLRLNTAGVIPPIFASSLLLFPATIGQFSTNEYVKRAAELFSPHGILYNIIYVALMFFFCYFYTAIIFDPKDMSENLKKAGGFIPGIRPGRPTAEFISKILSKITLIGAIFLAFVAILPILYSNLTGMYGLSMGGTSVIIMVGVALETVKQIESQMMMRHYKGFLD